MIKFRNASLVSSLAIAAFSLVSAMTANASTVGYMTTFPPTGTQATDFNYALTLPKFDSSFGTLLNVALYFYGALDVSNLQIANQGTLQQDDFEVTFSSNLVFGAANSATAADRFAGQTLSVFDSGTVSLGGSSTAACAPAAPTAGCSSVAYAPPDMTDSNIVDANVAGQVGTGVAGVTGIMKAGSQIANYIVGSSSTFALSGGLKSGTSFYGGGGNIVLNQNTVAHLAAEVDYTYAVVSGTSTTPEPATFALFGGALLCIGLLRKRTAR